MNDDEARIMAKLELFKNSLDHYSNLSTAFVSFIQSMLRVSLLLNGGAIIAALSVYGARGGEAPVWALIFWAVGLVLSTSAGFCIAKAQREFQVSAGHRFRQQGSDFFELEFPDQSTVAGGSVEPGNCWRDRFWRFWMSSIFAFVAGAASAISTLA